MNVDVQNDHETPDRQRTASEERKLKQRVVKQNQRLKRLQTETAEQKETRLAKQRQSTRSYREKQTQTQVSDNRRTNAEQHALSRTNETPAQTSARLDAVASSMASLRASENPAQTASRQATDRQNRSNARRRRLDLSKRTVVNDENEVTTFSAGKMDLECPHCKAKYFAQEANSQNVFTKCCQQGHVKV